jgi:hypothetical protein
MQKLWIISIFFLFSSPAFSKPFFLEEGQGRCDREDEPEGIVPEIGVAEIIELEIQEPITRREPLNQFFLGYGPTFLPDEIDPDGDPQLNLHAAYHWDLDYALLKVFGDFIFRGANAGMASAGLGLTYLILTDEDISPLVGAELG